MEQQEIVIVGSDGTEHVFPAGMDPQKAAAVVRQHEAEQAPKPVSSHEAGMGHDPLANAINRLSPGTGDYLEGAAQGLRDGVVSGAKGFVKGLVPGVIEGAKQTIRLPLTVAQASLGAAKGAYNLATDPGATAHGAVDSMMAIPGKVKEGVSAAVQKAGVDPEGFGNDVGRLTGASEVGVLTSKLAPMAPKPIARKIGAITEQVGTKGAWPIRMIGAHQLGSGNPMGIATMAMPEMLQKSGQMLQDFGADQAILAKEADILTQRGGAKTPRPSIRTSPPKDYYDVAKTNAAESTGGAAASSAEAEAVAQLRAAGVSEESIARAVKSGAVTNARPVDKAPVLGPVAGSERVKATGKAATDLALGKRPSAPTGPESTLQDLAVKKGTGVDFDGAVVKQQMEVENAARLQNRNTRVPVSEGIPASKSKSPMSATPGLSEADVKALGLNPKLPIKDLTPEALETLKKARAGRHANFYEGAKMDKNYKNMFEAALADRMDRLR